MTSDAAGEKAGGDPEVPRPTPAPSGTTGGDGRVTLAVSRSDAETLLRSSTGSIRVRARGTRREFELFSLLRGDGKRIRRVELPSGSPLDGATLGSAGLREAYGVAVLAVRRGGTWTVAPPGTTRLAGGDELYVVGSRDDLDRFAEVGR